MSAIHEQAVKLQEDFSAALSTDVIPYDAIGCAVTNVIFQMTAGG